MKCYELSKELFVEEGYNGAKYYDKDAVDALLTEKDKDIAYWRKEYDKETQLTDALKDEIESLKASHYEEMVDAGMRERRLRRALYKACANWAHHRVFVRFKNNEKAWENVERKCRAKAESYL